MKYIYAFLMIFTICIGGCMSKEKEADIQKQGQKSKVSSAVDSIHINGVKVQICRWGACSLCLWVGARIAIYPDLPL